MVICMINRVAATLSSSRGRFQALRHTTYICSSHAVKDVSGMVD